MDMRCADVYLIAVLADDEDPNATNIQKIFEGVETGYDSAVTMKSVYVFKENENTLEDLDVTNSLVALP